MNVLVVDDHRSALRVLVDIVCQVDGVQILEASNLKEASSRIAEAPIDLAFVDLRLSDDPRNRDGLRVLEELRRTSQTRAVIVSGLGDLAEVRAAMRVGAYDYLLKEDVCEEVILPLLEDLRSRDRLEREVIALRAKTRSVSVPGLVGSSQAMERFRAMLARIAASDRPVLVAGPSGAGKELAVQALHALGPSPDEPLMDVNCGALPESLIEAQLFGYERGAFTGAERRTLGYFAAVRKGTLFLDEIAELALPLQARLLRVVETRRFRMVGSTVDQPFEGRLVAATHADLAERVTEGRFREDLMHRLDVLRLRVPSLEERLEDLPALVAHFSRLQPRPLHFTEDAVDLLRQSPWPGNVRQLRNLIDRLAVLCDDDPIGPEAISAHLLPRGSASLDSLRSSARAVMALPGEGDKLQIIERALIDEALSMSGGNKSAAARLLGVHRKVIERRLELESLPLK